MPKSDTLVTAADSPHPLLDKIASACTYVDTSGGPPTITLPATPRPWNLWRGPHLLKGSADTNGITLAHQAASASTRAAMAPLSFCRPQPLAVRCSIRT